MSNEVQTESMGDDMSTESDMLNRMQSPGTFTFMDLWAPYGSHGSEYRQADRLIQRERKSGNIRQLKRGVWEWVAEKYKPINTVSR